MASPQLEEGYTRIAHEILEQVYQGKFKFTKGQYAIILCIWRYTYGFQRVEHELSAGFIAEAIGLDKSKVKKELSNLIERKIVTVVSEYSFNSSRIIKFNKNYEEWDDGKVARRPLTRAIKPPAKPPTEKKAVAKKDDKAIETKAQVDEVWAYYVEKAEELGMVRRKTESKLKHIRARLNDNFKPEHLKMVIEHAFNDPFMLGQNDRKRTYLDIDNIMVNTEKVEKRLVRIAEEQKPIKTISKRTIKM